MCAKAGDENERRGGGTGHLGEDLVVDGLVGLDADHQLVLRLLTEEALRRRLRASGP